MTRSLPMLAAVFLAAAAASCAPTAETVEGAEGGATAQGRQCFNPNMVRNFRQGPRVGQIFVRAERNQVFELNAFGGCTNLDFAMRMSIVPDGVGLAGGRTCVGDSVRIVVPGSTSAASTCRARVTRVLTPEEVAALPNANRP